MPRKDPTAWGFKSVDAINFGTDFVKIFYQDPKDASINWLDFNKKANKFTAYGVIAAAGKAKPKSPVTVLTWKSDGTQKIRLFYAGPKNRMKEVIFDEGKNPKTGPLDALNVELHPQSGIAGTAFRREELDNMRLYVVGTGRNLREYTYAADGKAEWKRGVIVRENVEINLNTRVCCINLHPWSSPDPAIRVFLYDIFESISEYQWDEGGWHLGPRASFNLSPINNSIDCISTRTDTDKPRTYIYFVLPWKNTIRERFRIGQEWEAGKKAIELDRVHPFAVVNDAKEGDPDRMHMFLTNGRDFIHYIRNKGDWTEIPVPQANEQDNFTDVQSIIRSIDAAK
ncbi:hypothetical protein TWF281_003268 [Arthrobotrys megalospora]